MKRIVARGWLLCILLILAAPVVCGEAEEAGNPPDQAAGQPLEKIDEIIYYLENNHLSGIKRDRLLNGAIDGIFRELGDPYSRYFTNEEWEEYETPLMNRYVGIGLSLECLNNGTFRVERVLERSPAQEAGIRAGDYLLAVDGKKTDGLELDALVTSLKGEAGTSVELKLFRPAENKVFTVTLQRRMIEVAVVTSEMFAGNVGYVRLFLFSEDAAKQMHRALDRWKSEDLRGLVLDLRGNGGGLLEAARETAGLFVREGTFLYLRNRFGVETEVKIYDGASVSYPVVILVDRETASAAEVLTGALQDYGLAKVVGTTTYGKGTVQQTVFLRTGGVLKVTTEEYLTPKRRKVNHVGIQPDVYMRDPVAQTVAALRLLRVPEVTVAPGERGTERVNGVVTPAGAAPSFLKKRGALYVKGELLSAMAGVTLKWNGRTKQVELKGNGQSAAFAAGTAELLLENGSSYIRADAFAKRFPQVTVREDGNRLTLKMAGR